LYFMRASLHTAHSFGASGSALSRRKIVERCGRAAASLRGSSDLGEVRLALFHEGREGLLGRGLLQQATEAFALVLHLLQRVLLLAFLHQPLGLDQAGKRLARELARLR